MKKLLAIISAVALAFVVGCGGKAPEASVKIDSSRIGVCSWSWRTDMKNVERLMDEAGIKGVHLALGPFIAPDERHGGAELLGGTSIYLIWAVMFAWLILLAAGGSSAFIYFQF